MEDGQRLILLAGLHDGARSQRGRSRQRCEREERGDGEDGRETHTDFWSWVEEAAAEDLARVREIWKTAERVEGISGVFLYCRKDTSARVFCGSAT